MWEEDLEDKTQRRVRWLIGSVVAAILVVGGAAYWYTARKHTQAPPAPPAAAPVAPSAESQVSHPLPETGGGALPALNDSDPVAHDSLAGVLGQNAVEQFLVPQNIVRHIVVTADNLPRHRVAVELRPVKPTPGKAVTAVQGDRDQERGLARREAERTEGSDAFVEGHSSCSRWCGSCGVPPVWTRPARARPLPAAR